MTTQNLNDFIAEQDLSAGEVVAMHFSNEFIVPAANAFQDQQSIHFLGGVAAVCLEHIVDQIGVEQLDSVVAQLVEQVKQQAWLKL